MFVSTDDDLKDYSRICKFAPFTCTALLKEISEMNNKVNNLKRLPVIMGHFPSGSSTKNTVHFDQYVKHGKFQMFDYGERNNQRYYGQKTPPQYNLENITFPVHMYVGKYDKLADV